MTVTSNTSSLTDSLDSVRAVALATGLTYAGGVPPQLAYELFSAGLAQLVDVRTIEERKYVGHVPGSVHVAWASGTNLTRNPRFARVFNVLEGFEGEIDDQQHRGGHDG